MFYNIVWNGRPIIVLYYETEADVEGSGWLFTLRHYPNIYLEQWLSTF
jgi:hypothetical protein